MKSHDSQLSYHAVRFLLFPVSTKHTIQFENVRLVIPLLVLCSTQQSFLLKGATECEDHSTMRQICNRTCCIRYLLDRHGLICTVWSKWRLDPKESGARCHNPKIAISCMIIVDCWVTAIYRAETEDKNGHVCSDLIVHQVAQRLALSGALLTSESRLEVHPLPTTSVEA